MPMWKAWLDLERMAGVRADAMGPDDEGGRQV